MDYVKRIILLSGIQKVVQIAKPALQLISVTKDMMLVEHDTVYPVWFKILQTG